LERNMRSNERNRILVNGSLISLGLVAVLDNIFSHWLFKWHRILPDETLSEYLEIALFILAGLDIVDEIKNALTEKLDQALQLLTNTEEDKSSEAVEALDDFIVQAKEALKKKQAEELIKAAEEIKSDIVSSRSSLIEDEDSSGSGQIEDEQTKPAQTIEERIAVLKESVAGLDIADEIKNALSEKLDQALLLLANTDEDKSSEAVEALDGLISQANEALTEKQAEELIKAAEEIKSNIVSSR
jgi:predicted RecB family endonuclease